MTDLTTNVSKIIHAPIEKVFDAWLSPTTLSQFMLPMPGMAQPPVEIDACEGGEFTIMMQVGDDKIPHSGKYLKIDRPNKLVFSWNSPFSTDGSNVTLSFNSVGENKTNVDLSHVKFIDEESRDNHQGGWGNILESLNNVVS